MKHTQTAHEPSLPAALARGASVTLLLASLAGAASARTDPANDMVLDVKALMMSGDCTGAVAKLNAGLAKQYPEVQLLAGSMYDEGWCVKRSWERAVHYYVLAHDGGQRAAAPRLSAGFAAPENGPDIAAAMWWAAREKYGSGARLCKTSEQAKGDPDRFVAELQTWPQARLAACNYVIGVMMTLVGEIQYPGKQAGYFLSGDVQVDFLPSVPRIDVTTTETREESVHGWFDGDSLRERGARSMKRGFEDELRKVADRALKRYPQPAGIDPDWKVGMKFQFTLH